MRLPHAHRLRHTCYIPMLALQHSISALPFFILLFNLISLVG
nr:MAG TPA: hypothetical protein [Caudoviricetes sp.]